MKVFKYLNPINWFRTRKLDASEYKDPRNKSYPVRSVLPDGATIKTTHWDCPITLNQGKEGACCAFAVCHEGASNPCNIVGITNELAFSIYHKAQKIDEWEGEAYSGTSVNAVMKVAKDMGWYDEYRWVFGIEDLKMALTYCGPAIMSLSWYKGMYQPKHYNMIHKSGKQTGRHAILCNGYDKEEKLFRLHNSWGKNWGWNSECWISEEDMEQLLKAGGTACIPLIRNRKEVSDGE